MLRLFEILNAISELVYVADIETYELLYMNKPGVELFQCPDYQGKKCYEVLQGRDTPCDFCTNSVITNQHFHTWKYQNPVTNGYFLLKDRLIEWKGKPARIEIAFETTETELQRIELQNMLDLETVLVECITELHKPVAVQEGIDHVLAIVGKFLEAERAYIFRNDGATMSNSYEWCADGITPEIQNLQNLDINLLNRWMPYFSKGECVIIEDLEKIRYISPEEYAVLKPQGIHSLVAAPLESDGQLIGYIGVDNPPEGKLKRILPFFTTLRYFLTSVIIKHRTEEMLRVMSFRDILTGLNNRNRFMQDVDVMNMNQVEKLGVLYADLNGLKDINDKLGHTYGDKVLIEMSTVLTEAFGKAATYRLGGDEFVVLCAPIEETEFRRRVKQLKEQLEAKDFCAALGYQYMASYRDIDLVVREADERMYADKKAFYRNSRIEKRYRHNNDIFAEFMTVEALESLMETGRFPVWFQPKFSVKEQQIVGAEALIRYIDEDGTLVGPDRFIPDAEDAGLCHIIDFYMLNTVCKLVSQWIAQGKKVVPIAVNLSRSTLVSHNFLENLLKLWGIYNLPRKLIEFEITEDTDIAVMPRVLEILRQMKELGFSISIDDFGSKYANLFLFNSINFDCLKLDRSLIQGIHENEKSRSIIEATLEICHKNGVSVVAEGVETEQELAVLRDMQCDSVQGFIFARPIPQQDFINQFLEG